MDYMAHYEKSARMWSQGLHAHDYYEIYIHLEGAKLYCVDDIIYELEPNQLLIIPPLHMHGLICERDLLDYERCYLYLSPEMLQKCGLGKIDMIDIIDRAYKEKKILHCLSSDSAMLCRENLQQIERLSSIGNNNRQLECFSLIIQLLQLVADSVETKNPPEPAGSSNNSIIPVLHYINDNYTKNITIESLSKEFHISESSLAHKFKENVNKGIYEYILYKRVIKAKELMSTDKTLTEIAFLCGFSDYSNFLRAFSKSTGMSPRKYREKNSPYRW